MLQVPAIPYRGFLITAVFSKEGAGKIAPIGSAQVRAGISMSENQLMILDSDAQ